MTEFHGQDGQNSCNGLGRMEPDELVDDTEGHEQSSHTTEEPKVVASQGTGGSVAYRLGRYVGNKYMETEFVYDPVTEHTWAYIKESGTWRIITQQFLLDYVNARNYLWAQILKNSGRQKESKVLTWSSPPAARNAFWSGLRHALTAPEPMPELHYIPTLNGTVDLRIAKLTPHEPKYMCRSAVAANFYPDSKEDMQRILAERLGRVFTKAMLREYLAMVGLCLSGKAQSYRSLMLVYGASGTGKGGAIRLIADTLGEMAIGVGAWYFSQNRRQNEIDTIRTKIHLKVVRFVAVDELTSDIQVAESRFLSMTGDNRVQDSRKPYGAEATGGVARFMMGTTAVSAPAMTRHGGIERRLAAIPTKGILLKNELKDPTQDELDALFTLAALQATRIYKDNYMAPTGDEKLKDEILTTGDAFNDLMQTIAKRIQEQPEGIPFHLLVAEVHHEVDRTLQPGRIGQLVAATKLFAHGRGHDLDGNGQVRKLWDRDLPENQRT